MQPRPMLLDPRQRSADPAVCPFLRSVDPSAALAPPIEGVDPSNVCLASASSETPPPGQQESRCLLAAHVSCVRYLTGAPAMPAAGAVRSSRSPADGTLTPGAFGSELGADAVSAGPGPTPAMTSAPPDDPRPEPVASAPTDPVRGETRPRRPTLLTGPIIVAALFLLGSTATAIGFAAARGGIELPVASPSAAAVATIAPSATPGPSSGASAVPTSSAAATPRPTPAPTPAPTPVQTSDRYAVLEACPDTPDCYIYTIRQGDNLRSIANYFGVPYQTVLDLNPWIVDPSTVHRGEKLTLPPPTR